MDLSAHSLCALDWSVITEQLAQHARTGRGQVASAQVDLTPDLAEAECRYRAVAEVDQLESEGERVPLGSIHDLRQVLDRAERGGVLDASDLQQVRDTMVGIHRLQGWVMARGAHSPELQRLLNSKLE